MSPSSVLAVDAVNVSVVPGQATPAVISVQNLSDRPLMAALRTIGLEEGWAAPPSTIGPIGPGERVETELTVGVPAGFPPCEHLAAVEAQPVDPVTSAPLGPPASTDLVVVVGDGSQIQATLDPAHILASGHARFFLTMRNRSRQSMRVHLEAAVPGKEFGVEFDDPDPVLPPGHNVQVRGKLKARRQLFGGRRRFPFFIRVEGRSTPVQLDGSFTQRSTLSGEWLKILAVIALLALWVGVLLAGLDRLNPKKIDQNAATANASAAGATSSSGSGGGGTDSGGGGGTDSGGGGGGAGGESAAAPTEVKVGGKIKAKDPAGFTITIIRTSLVDENAQGATYTAGAQPGNSLAGMHYGHLSASAPRLAAEAKRTVSDSDGVWSFAGIPAPGYYLVTVAKGGYGTRKFVVNATTTDGAAVKVDADMVPGDGSLAGLVTDGNGNPIGGVDLTISDGTNALTTATPTAGSGVGSWSITGLNTPTTYLVTASRSGFGTQSELVTLDAGGSNGNVDISMAPDLGSIAGLVIDTSSTGVGGLTVTVTDGATTRTVTTQTVGPGGSGTGAFVVPLLPMPGTYTMTVSGQGYLTSTQTVTVPSPTPLLTVQVTPATGAITGTILGLPLDSTFAPVANATPGPLGLVGITMTSESITLKTTSATTAVPGFFNQPDVPPGHYVITFDKFGYVSESTEVNVVAGQTVSVPVAPSPPTPDTPFGEPAGTTYLPPVGFDALHPTGKVTVTAVDQKTAQPLDPTTDCLAAVLTNDANPGTAAQPAINPDGFTGGCTGATGAGLFTFTKVDPGLASITVRATRHAPTTIKVTVIPNLQIDATAVLENNAVVTGLVRDRSGAKIVVPAGLTVPCTDETGTIDVAVCVLAKQVGVTNPRTVRATVPDAPDPNSYTFDGTLDPGVWSLTANAPGYVENQPILIPVVAGKTIPQDITLQQLGAIEVHVQGPNAAGALVDLSGVNITISPPGPGPSPQPTINGIARFVGLLAGDYTVTPDPNDPNYQLPPGQSAPTVHVELDSTTTVGIALVAKQPAPADFRGTLHWNDNGPTVVDRPPTITIIGVGSYTANPNPPPPATANEVTLTCAPDPNLPGNLLCTGGSGTATGSYDTSTGTFDIKTDFQFSLASSVVIEAPGFARLSLSNQTIFTDQAAPLPDFTLEPLGVSVTGKVTFSPDDTLSKAGVAATLISPLGSGVTLSVDPSTGSINVRDPRVAGVNVIRPGHYQVLYTKSGFDNATVPAAGTLTVNPGDPSADLGTTMVQRGSLEVTVECKVGGPTGAGLPSVPPSARVTLSGTAPQTLTAVNGVLPPASFPDLSAGNYNLAVQAAGCANDDNDSVSVTSGSSTTPKTATLTKLGSITGHVVLKVNSATTTDVDVPNATVSTPDPNSPTPFTATTDDKGTFLLTGVLDQQGLFDQGGTPRSYEVTVSLPGTTADVTRTATILNSGDCVAVPTSILSCNAFDLVTLELIATPGNIKGTVTESSTNGPLADATVTATSGVVNRRIEVKTKSDGTYDFDSSDLEPVQWVLDFSAPNHSSVQRTWNLAPGATVTDNEVLDSRLNRIIGTASTQFPSQAARLENGVNVHVTALDNGNASPADVLTTNAVGPDGTTRQDGVYSFSDLKDGNYSIVLSKIGFVTSPVVNVKLSGGQFVEVTPVTLAPVSAQVNLTFVSAVPAAPIAGTDVTLTPQSGSRAAVQQGRTSTDGTLVLNNVPQSTYVVTITAVGGHRTTLDQSTLTVPPTQTTPLSATFHVQEARLGGTVTTQTSAAAGQETDGVVVTVKSGTATVATSTSANGGKWSFFVPANTSPGYSIVFSNGSTYQPVTKTASPGTGADLVVNANVPALATVVIAPTTTTPVAGTTYSYQVRISAPASKVTTDVAAPHTYTLLEPVDASGNALTYTFTVIRTATPTTGPATTTTTAFPIAIHPGDNGSPPIAFP